METSSSSPFLPLLRDESTSGVVHTHTPLGYQAVTPKFQIFIFPKKNTAPLTQKKIDCLPMAAVWTIGPESPRATKADIEWIVNVASKRIVSSSRRQSTPPARRRPSRRPPLLPNPRRPHPITCTLPPLGVTAKPVQPAPGSTRSTHRNTGAFLRWCSKRYGMIKKNKNLR